MAGLLKNNRQFQSGYYLVDNLKGNYEIPSYILELTSSFVPTQPNKTRSDNNEF